MAKKKATKRAPARAKAKARPAAKKAAAKKVSPIPPGYTSVTPYLTVNDGAGALAFYQRAFGAREVMRMAAPGGKIGHAEMRIGNAIVMLSDEFPGVSSQKAPTSLGGTTGSLMLYVPNVDAAFKRATDAGCTSIMAPTDMFWGDRFGKLEDPYGNQWGLATHVKDVPPKQMAEAGQGRDGPDGAGQGSLMRDIHVSRDHRHHQEALHGGQLESRPRDAARLRPRPHHRALGRPASRCSRSSSRTRRSPGPSASAYCQDTGVAVCFVELGQDVHVTGGGLYDAINEGVRQGYKEGFLRASMVKSPFDRVNTGDNTPAVIHVDVVPGAELKLAIMAKGGGCENRSKYTMLTPAAGIEGVKDFIIECVKMAGPDACPPLILGVGVGGTFEKAALNSKKALFREVGSPNPDPFLDTLEKELLDRANRLGIGPQGYGGDTTSLGIHVHLVPVPHHVAARRGDDRVPRAPPQGGNAVKTSVRAPALPAQSCSWGRLGGARREACDDGRLGGAAPLREQGGDAVTAAPGKIIWTEIDEAPALATYSLLPIIRKFTGGAGITHRDGGHLPVRANPRQFPGRPDRRPSACRTG